jgi:light-regulated signal transduction histidine kinase (bacteriophytochrome)
LKQQNERLERLVGELNEFNYMASHDLQEPLRTMSTYCGLLSQDVGNPKRTAEDVAAILDSSLRMQRLITNLLDYSRAGDAKIRRVPVDLAAVMQGVSRDLRNRMAEGEGSLQWDRLPTVPGDEVQLSRLFQNLVANGLKFRKPGVPPVVQVSAESMNGDVRITVRDNGIGIDPKHFSQIFKPFRRLHGADKYEGTGIGLSICRKIVEQHGGRIDVSSQAGEGCSFVVTLPLEDSADGRNR